MNMEKLASGEGADEALADMLASLRAARKERAANPQPPVRRKWQYQNANPNGGGM